MSRRARLLLGWGLAVLAIALFLRLGYWQSGRAVEKAGMLEHARAALDTRRPRVLAVAHAAGRARAYDWAQGRGRFIGPPLWLDNQQREGRVGVRAYRVFRSELGDLLLVDAGWAPMAADRRALPVLELPERDVDVRGLLAPPPSAGLRVGAPLTREHDAWLMLRVDTAAIAEALALPGPLAPRVLRLDPALPFGAARDLDIFPNTLPPDKHRGYAVQWFGLAITVLVIALVLTFRGSRR